MKVYMGVGGNLGNREQNLRNALKALEKQIGTLVAVSPVYETEPFGFDSNDRFLNIVVAIETILDPNEILERIRIIENRLGRERETGKYVSRTIDIDLLFYGNQIIDNAELIVPHPRLHERKFVLVPLCDIAPGFIHPVLNRSIKEILESSKDRSIVEKRD
jgi:2-amino-4-hydroxy-6-hydroxymethyldihydropteridine diphosphokinase